MVWVTGAAASSRAAPLARLTRPDAAAESWSPSSSVMPGEVARRRPSAETTRARVTPGVSWAKSARSQSRLAVVIRGTPSVVVVGGCGVGRQRAAHAGLCGRAARLVTGERGGGVGRRGAVEEGCGLGLRGAELGGDVRLGHAAAQTADRVDRAGGALFRHVGRGQRWGVDDEGARARRR